MPKFKLKKVKADELGSLKLAASVNGVTLEEDFDQVADECYLEGHVRSNDALFEFGRLHEKLVQEQKSKSK